MLGAVLRVRRTEIKTVAAQEFLLELGRETSKQCPQLGKCYGRIMPQEFQGHLES